MTGEEARQAFLLWLGAERRASPLTVEAYGTDIAGFGAADDVAFARYLVKDVGVAAVPGSSFYRRAELGRTKLRFCFCKKDETLAAAEDRLRTLRGGVNT